MIVLLHRKKAARRANMIMSKALYQSGALVMAAAGNWQESGIGGALKASCRPKGPHCIRSYGIPCPDGKMRRRRSLLFPRVNLAIFAPCRTPCSRRIRTQRSYSAGPPEPKRTESFRVQPAAVDDAPTAAAQALQIHKQPNAGSKSRKGVPIEAGTKRISAVSEQASDHSPFP